jgi:hypothetical protein
MPKRLTFKGSHVEFPQVCLICQAPAYRSYEISNTLYYGNRSVTLKMPMPLCEDHFAVASRQSAAERWIGRIGLGLGVVAGLAVAAALLSWWSSTGQGSAALNVFLAAFVGLSAWVLTWAVCAFVVVPRFGDYDSRAVRGAMKIRHYWPGSGDMQLEFASPVAAELVAKINRDRLLRTE